MRQLRLGHGAHLQTRRPGCRRRRRQRSGRVKEGQQQLQQSRVRRQRRAAAAGLPRLRRETGRQPEPRPERFAEQPLPEGEREHGRGGGRVGAGPQAQRHVHGDDTADVAECGDQLCGVGRGVLAERGVRDVGARAGFRVAEDPEGAARRRAWGEGSGVDGAAEECGGDEQ